MKKSHIITVFFAAFLLLTGACKSPREVSASSGHGNLVILHTNDTHSAIEPDRNNLGGIARRKVIIDSVRQVRDNVLLVDAGDAVQGSMYYTMFSGEVERKLMNALGYDVRILGNHEFDKGLDALAREWKELSSVRLSTNYEFDGTPLDGLFVKSLIKDFGGKKVGFIGINLNPEGIISEDNYKGVEYEDAIETANSAAAKLKAEGADIVIAVTHIGYKEMPGESDVDLAKASKDIDIIIGGHSHTVIDPKAKGNDIPTWHVKNADGKNVAVLQTGSSGVNVGEIDINLNNGDVKAKLIPVNSRLDNRIDKDFEKLIEPYRERVDSMRNFEIGYSPYDYERKSTEMLNLLSDFVKQRGDELFGRPVDLAIMNKGGIRNSLSAGKITQGEVIDIAPFDNSIVVMEIEGEDLLENFKVMATQDGQGVSRGVEAVYDPLTHELLSVTINGEEIDPERDYYLATIDYLAAGNDYMEPLKEGEIMAESPEILYKILIDYIKDGRLDSLLSAPDKQKRMRPVNN